MKFGKRLHRAAASFVDPAYAAHLLDYKALKKLIKRLTSHPMLRAKLLVTPSQNASIANTSPSLSSSSSSPAPSRGFHPLRPSSLGSAPNDGELSKQLAASSLSTPTAARDSVANAASSASSSAAARAPPPSSSSSTSSTASSLSISIPPSMSHTSLHRVSSSGSPDSNLSTPSASPSPPSSAHPFSPSDECLLDHASMARDFIVALEAELSKINSFYAHVVASLTAQVVALRQSLPRDGDLSSLSDVCEQMSQLRKFIVLNYLGVIKAVKKFDKNAALPVAERMIPFLYAQPFYHSLQVAQLYTEVDSMSRMGMKSVRRDDFNCPLCGDLLECPVVLSCSHRFCWKCLSRAAHSASMDDACPVCLKPQLLDPSNYIVDDLLLQFIRANFPKKHANSAHAEPRVLELRDSPPRETQLVGVRRGSQDVQRRDADESVHQSSSTSPSSTASALLSGAVGTSLSAFTSASSSSMMSPMPASFLFSPPTFLLSHNPAEDSNAASLSQSHAQNQPFQPSQRQAHFDLQARGEQQQPQQQHSDQQQLQLHHEYSPFLLASGSPVLSPSPSLPMDFHLDPSNSPPTHHRLSTRPWQTHAGTGDKFLLPWLPEDEEDEDVCADVQHEPVNLGYHWPSYNDYVDEDAIERVSSLGGFHPSSQHRAHQQQHPQTQQQQQQLGSGGGDREDFAMQQDDERLQNSTSPLSSSSSSPSSEHSLSSSDILQLTSINHLFMNDSHDAEASGMDQALSPTTTFLTAIDGAHLPPSPDVSLPAAPRGSDEVADHMSQLQANLAEAMRQQQAKAAPAPLSAHSATAYHHQQQQQQQQQQQAHFAAAHVNERRNHPRSNSFQSESSGSGSHSSHSPRSGYRTHRTQQQAQLSMQHSEEAERGASAGFADAIAQHQHQVQQQQQQQLLSGGLEAGGFTSSEYHFHGSASSAPTASPSPLMHFSPSTASRRSTQTSPSLGPTLAVGSSNATTASLPSPQHRPFVAALSLEKAPLAIATSSANGVHGQFTYPASAPTSPHHPAPPGSFHHAYGVAAAHGAGIQQASSGLGSPHSGSSSSSVVSLDGHSQYHPARHNGNSGLGGEHYAGSAALSHSDAASAMARANSFSSVHHALPSPSSSTHMGGASMDGFSHGGHQQPLHIQIPPATGHPSILPPHVSPPTQPHAQHHSNGTTTVWVPIQVSNMQAAQVQGGGRMSASDGADGDEKAEAAHPVTLLHMQTASPSHSSPPASASGATTSASSSAGSSPTGSQSAGAITPATVLNRPFLRRVPRFLCQHPGCSDGFNTRFSLKRHVKMHTGEKPYPCTQCPKSFAEKSTLIRHLRIHTGERPFACSWTGCERVFSDRTNVRRHEQQHELQKDLPLDEQTAMMSEQAEKEVLKKREQDAQLKRKQQQADERSGNAMNDGVDRERPRPLHERATSIKQEAGPPRASEDEEPGASKGDEEHKGGDTFMTA